MLIYYLFILFFIPYSSQINQQYIHPSNRHYVLSDPIALESNQLFISANIPKNAAYSDNTYISNTELCNMMINQLIAYGNVATSIYDTCQFKYQLLGFKNPVITLDQPQCYMNLAASFCKYDIIYQSTPYSIDTIETVLQNIVNCIDVTIIINFKEN